MTKTNTKELTVQAVEKELNPMLSAAQKMVIKGPKEMKEATEMLSQLNLAKDKVTERMETITKPAKETVKAAEAIWKPWINQAKDAILCLRGHMSDYQTEQQKIADDAAAKIAARVGEGKGKLKMETAMDKIADIDVPEVSHVAESGSVKFRPMKVFKVVDLSKVPAEYMVADEVKIGAAMKAGIEIAGVEYSTKQVPVNSR